MVWLGFAVSRVPKCEGPGAPTFSGAIHLLGTWGTGLCTHRNDLPDPESGYPTLSPEKRRKDGARSIFGDAHEVISARG